jgi:chromate reductase, NAD(P)H dehydrogenase (quinone)
MELLERSPWKIVRLYRARAADSVPRRVQILALGGSLREASFNRALLHEAAALVPAGVDLDLGLLDVPGALPLFNQDIVDRDGFPPAAVRLREALRAADGLLVATPEYNWGIPGFLKNAIDWMSRPASDIPQVFGDLPVALVGAGGGGGTRLAQSAWLPVFRFLRMRPWSDETLYLSGARTLFDEHGRLTDDATRDQLRAVVAGFAAHCAAAPRTRPG